MTGSPKTITLVTGNAGKLNEWKRLFPASIQLVSADVDLEEIQSLDLEAIVTDKAKRAYDKIGEPVLVEDISASLSALNGLPGPFIKFFEMSMGPDALFQLAENRDKTALVSCLIAYYDGKQTIIARSEVAGTVVSARGNNGFGFDVCFVPDGQAKTYAEMSPAQKDAISHRASALKDLIKQLKQL